MILAIVIGFMTAFIGSLVGLGGGVIFVPVMLFLADNVGAFDWATPQIIVGTSLVVMIFTGLSSTIAYYQQKRVDIKTGAIFLIGSIPGTLFGTFLNSNMNTDAFSLYLGILLVFIFGLLLIDRNKIRKNKPLQVTAKTRTFTVEGQQYQYNVSLPIAFIMAFIIGTLSGLFGIGGGTISVPVMMLFFGMPVQVAVGTSMFIIFFTSLIGASSHIVLGHVIWGYALFFMIGSYLGGTIGAKTSKRLKGKTLEWFLRIIIFIIAVRLIFESI